MEKICSRFYWESMTLDIREYVKRCDVCQRCNDAKFVKANAALHPIPVKPKVWQQVLCLVIAKTVAMLMIFFRLASI